MTKSKNKENKNHAKSEAKYCTEKNQRRNDLLVAGTPFWAGPGGGGGGLIQAKISAMISMVIFHALHPRRREADHKVIKFVPPKFAIFEFLDLLKIYEQ